MSFGELAAHSSAAVSHDAPAAGSQLMMTLNNPLVK
jgi:hypothetical protein